MMRLQVCCTALAILDLAGVPLALTVQERDRRSASGDERPIRADYDELVPASLADDPRLRNCARLGRGDPADGAEEKSVEAEEGSEWFINRTKRMEALEESGWKELEPIPYVKMPPKLAVLMFATDGVNNEKVWLNWIQQAKRDGLPFNFLIHRTSFDMTWKSGGLSEYLVPSSVDVQWCNMYPAQVLMMRRALIDPHVSHMVVVSRDSIPVKPLRYFYKALGADPSTRMCADDSWRGWGGTPRAESWWLMRREDAQLFEDNHLLSKRLFTMEGCVDEQAWYYPLRMREEKWGSDHAVRDECIMFADWEDGPNPCKDWRRTVELCTGCDKLRHSLHYEANGAHPAAFVNVSAEAVRGLLDSPFWFARKFTDGAIQPDAVALLAEHGAAQEAPNE